VNWENHRGGVVKPGRLLNVEGIKEPFLRHAFVNGQLHITGVQENFSTKVSGSVKKTSLLRK